MQKKWLKRICKFGSWLSPEAHDFVSRWTPIRKALSHKAFHSGSAVHRKFLVNTLEKIKALRHLADMENEILSLEKQLEL